MCLVKNHNEESRILGVIGKIIGLICVYLCNPQFCREFRLPPCFESE